jgi:hypothetical protein
VDTTQSVDRFVGTASHGIGSMTDQDLLEVIREFALTLYARGATSAAGVQPEPDIRPSERQAESTTSQDVRARDKDGAETGVQLPNRLMTVTEVAEYLGMARSTVDQMPMAVLPYADLSPTHKRQHKRFDPRDVAAALARHRAWSEARQRGEGEEFLEDAERALRERDAEVIRRAMEWEVAA